MKQYPEYEILITRADNGYILTRTEEIESDGVRKYRTVVTEEETFDAKGEKEAARTLLYEILTYFSVNGLTITIDPTEE